MIILRQKTKLSKHFYFNNSFTTSFLLFYMFSFFGVWPASCLIVLLWKKKIRNFWITFFASNKIAIFSFLQVRQIHRCTRAHAISKHIWFFITSNNLAKPQMMMRKVRKWKLRISLQTFIYMCQVFLALPKSRIFS